MAFFGRFWAFLVILGRFSGTAFRENATLKNLPKYKKSQKNGRFKIRKIPKNPSNLADFWSKKGQKRVFFGKKNVGFSVQKEAKSGPHVLIGARLFGRFGALTNFRPKKTTFSVSLESYKKIHPFGSGNYFLIPQTNGVFS